MVRCVLFLTAFSGLRWWWGIFHCARYAGYSRHATSFRCNAFVFQLFRNCMQQECDFGAFVQRNRFLFRRLVYLYTDSLFFIIKQNLSLLATSIFAVRIHYYSRYEENIFFFFKLYFLIYLQIQDIELDSIMDRFS